MISNLELFTKLLRLRIDKRDLFESDVVTDAGMSAAFQSLYPDVELPSYEARKDYLSFLCDTYSLRRGDRKDEYVIYRIPMYPCSGCYSTVPHQHAYIARG